jgi:hypothetical protein
LTFFRPVVELAREMTLSSPTPFSTSASSCLPNILSRASAYLASRSSLVSWDFFSSLCGTKSLPLLSTPTSDVAAEGPSEFAAVDVSDVFGSSGRLMIFLAGIINGGVFETLAGFGSPDNGGGLSCQKSHQVNPTYILL